MWSNILKDTQNNEKDVKTTIVAANNHYAGFCPMTAKLFAEMMDLKNHVRTFPILDYKISFSSEKSIFENNYNNKIYKQQYSKKIRQTDISEFFK